MSSHIGKMDKSNKDYDIFDNIFQDVNLDIDGAFDVYYDSLNAVKHDIENDCNTSKKRKSNDDKKKGKKENESNDDKKKGKKQNAATTFEKPELSNDDQNTADVTGIDLPKMTYVDDVEDYLLENVRNTSKELGSNDDNMEEYKNAANTCEKPELSNDDENTAGIDLTKMTYDVFDDFLPDLEKDIEMLPDDEYAFQYFIEDESKLLGLSPTLHDAVKKEEVRDSLAKPDDNSTDYKHDCSDTKIDTIPTIARQTKLENKCKETKELKVFMFSLVKTPITTPRPLNTIRNLYIMRGDPLRFLQFDKLIGNVVDFENQDIVTIRFSMPTSISDYLLPIECGICPMIMKHSELSNHIKIHQDPKTKRYMCLFCNKTYSCSNYLAGHVRRHLGIKPYQCFNCTLQFSTKYEAIEHQKKTVVKTHKVCDICERTYSDRRALERHRELEHDAKPQFQCPHCSHVSCMKFLLNEHILSAHNDQRHVLEFEFHETEFCTPHLLTEHRKENHFHKPIYLCYVCEHFFVNRNVFNAHRISTECREKTLSLEKKYEAFPLSDQVEVTYVSCIIDKNGNFTYHSIIDELNSEYEHDLIVEPE